MKILIANDDGIRARGIYALAKELSKEHEVVVVAPREERSASSHSITLFKPISIKEEVLEGINCKAYSISGTPADCVRVGIDKLAKDIDIVISGINRGVNLGTDVIYSGTVSAAMEAAIYDLLSIAISQEVDWNRNDEDYTVAAKYASSILKTAEKNYLKPNVVLNVNVPNKSKGEIKGIKVCPIGKSTYTHEYIKIEGEEYPETYKISGIRNEREETLDDIGYVEKGYITLTPLHYDLTNFKLLEEAEEIFEQQK